MIYNCIHGVVCYQLGEYGYCAANCSEYQRGKNNINMRKVIEKYHDIILPYDMSVVIEQPTIFEKNSRTVRLYLRNGEKI